MAERSVQAELSGWPDEKTGGILPDAKLRICDEQRW